MSFQPIVPASGLTGWVFLTSTLERQTGVFDTSPEIIRDTDYFAQNIGAVRTADDLVSNRRLLRVTLGAFGLQDDIDSRAFIQRILAEGTTDDDALANKLADDRYRKLADAFGFERPGGPATQEAGFADRINALFRQRSFEIAVGRQDDSLRLALNAKRELAQIATSDDSEDTKWFTIMGTQPLRKVFETALGLPASFAQLDLDRQLVDFKARAAAQLGLDSLEDLADSKLLGTLIERFLLRDQVAQGASMSSQAIALTLLQSVVPPG